MIFCNPLIYKVIPVEDRQLFCAVNSLIGKTEDYVTNNFAQCKGLSYRCHSICRAIVNFVPGLKVIDGKYLGVLITKVENKEYHWEIATCDHSWLITKNKTIIDPYPVGCLNVIPLLIPGKGKSIRFGRAKYIRNKSVTTIASQPKFIAEAERLKEVMRRALLTHKGP